MPRRRHRTKNPEDEILSKGSWSGLRENNRIAHSAHSAEENAAAEHRCRQFLEGGVDAIEWKDLLGER